MALIERELKRDKLVAKYAKKHAELKAIASGNPLVVKSDEARVYYGHGQRTFANDTAGNRRPEFDAATVGSLNDPDAASQNARLGSDVDPDNPNRYAGDWTLPRQFWKVVTIIRTATMKLSPTAYLLTQVNQVTGLDFAFGEFRTYQVSVRQIEAMTNLRFGNLKTFDPKEKRPSLTLQPLTRLEDIEF